MKEKQPKKSDLPPGAENINKIYTHAFELARLLQESDEYTFYSSARKNLQEDNHCVHILSRFRHMQLTLHLADAHGEDVAEEMVELEETYSLMCDNPLISDFVHAEGKFTRLLADVQKIFGKALDLWPGFEFAWKSSNENLN